ncbi:MAG: hypothetical protein ACK529_05445, partial [Alphaproteobacteria bacterium]
PASLRSPPLELQTASHAIGSLPLHLSQLAPVVLCDLCHPLLDPVSWSVAVVCQSVQLDLGDVPEHCFSVLVPLPRRETVATVTQGQQVGRVEPRKPVSPAVPMGSV